MFRTTTACPMQEMASVDYWTSPHYLSTTGFYVKSVSKMMSQPKRGTYGQHSLARGCSHLLPDSITSGRPQQIWVVLLFEFFTSTIEQPHLAACWWILCLLFILLWNLGPQLVHEISLRKWSKDLTTMYSIWEDQDKYMKSATIHFVKCWWMIAIFISYACS